MLAVRPTTGADGQGSPTGAAAVERRRLQHRLQLLLERSVDAGALVLLDDPQGYILLPRPVGSGPDQPTGRPTGLPTDPPADPSTDLPAGLPRLLADACGEELPLSVAGFTDVAGFVQAAGTAREVLRLCLALDRGPGPHRLADVLLEYHLSRPGHSAGALSTLLDPVLAQPELAATVRGYIARQQDRRATAQALGLHPNTVDNRIRRAGELIGTDLTTPRGYALALAAMAARDLGRPPHPDPPRPLKPL
ncbi:helix-turn-helix domain-containing protein [Streptacidiphilus sp. EB129]|uniref:helix-turn-helix domain-containing protein n=1 Tax=Streptacidiphilus sp. EB129 TaxID=3156262 RepID=UPI003512CC00